MYTCIRPPCHLICPGRNPAAPFRFFFLLETEFFEGKRKGHPKPRFEDKNRQYLSGFNIFNQLDLPLIPYLPPSDPPHRGVTLWSLPDTGHKDFYQRALLHIAQVWIGRRMETQNHELATLHLHVLPHPYTPLPITTLPLTRQERNLLSFPTRRWKVPPDPQLPCDTRTLVLLQ